MECDEHGQEFNNINNDLNTEFDNDTFNNQGNDDFIDNPFYVDIKMVQRNGKKVITIIENLFSIPNVDINKLVQIWKKKFACNVFIEKNDNNSEKMIKMTGNQIYNVQEYLIKEKICSPSIIRIH